MSSTLIYVDDCLVVVNKAAGVSLVTHRSEPHAAVERLLGSIDPQECEKWGLAPEDLHLVHRLDIGTTGLVVLARNPETHKELATAFRSRSVEKTYLALVWGHPRPQEGRYDWPIGPNRSDWRRMRVDPSGRSAVTCYRTLTRGRHVSLLELHPETGRTHQLRVHLAKAGHWIVGDDLYGGARHRGVKEEGTRALLNPPHLLLHAWQLHLAAGTSLGERIFEAPLPVPFCAALAELGMILPPTD